MSFRRLELKAVRMNLENPAELHENGNPNAPVDKNILAEYTEIVISSLEQDTDSRLKRDAAEITKKILLNQLTDEEVNEVLKACIVAKGYSITDWADGMIEVAKNPKDQRAKLGALRDLGALFGSELFRKKETVTGNNITTKIVFNIGSNEEDLRSAPDRIKQCSRFIDVK